MTLTVTVPSTREVICNRLTTASNSELGHHQVQGQEGEETGLGNESETAGVAPSHDAKREGHCPGNMPSLLSRQGSIHESHITMRLGNSLLRKLSTSSLKEVVPT